MTDPASATQDSGALDAASQGAGAPNGSTGRAAEAFGPGRMEIREYPVLPPQPDQVLVRVSTRYTVSASGWATPS